MRKILVLVLLLCVVLMVQTSVVKAQAADAYPRIGIQGHVGVPATEFWESQGLKMTEEFRGLFRFSLSKYLKGEIGGGYLRLSGLDFKRAYYRTNVYPLDFRVLLFPMPDASVRPFIYAGAGGFYYRCVILPQAVNPVQPIPLLITGQDGFGGFVPVGAGIEFSLSKSVSMELSGGYNHAFNDNLNYAKFPWDGDWNTDGWATVGLGLTISLNKSNADDDKDGLTNDEEEKLGTDPNNPDTDGDGLSDGDEVKTYHTDPLKADTDGDGLKDGDEVMKYKTDPLKVDTDGDGLNDGDEVLKYHTDPLNPDTDGDGLNDGNEVTMYKTDPLLKDTDGDGLTDGDEVLKYKTNPLNRDTDGGTVDDGTEVRRGTDPLNPADDVVKVQAPIILEGIEFASGKADIKPVSALTLEKALTTLKTYSDIEVEISGHTDIIGGHAMNMKLSQRRADAVKNWLVEKGIDPKRITAKGYGPDKPIATNKTKEGRQQNRRIEFVRIR
jgi:outer membrane protein OmpA-like peptidoglycan-associated protein